VLKIELKLADRAERPGKGDPQVLNGLKEWILVGTIWRPHAPTKTNPDQVQSVAQPLEQMINRFQGQGRLDPVENAADGAAGQKPDQQLPQHGG
jgi:hypothetical protein